MIDRAKDPVDGRCLLPSTNSHPLSTDAPPKCAGCGRPLTYGLKPSCPRSRRYPENAAGALRVTIPSADGPPLVTWWCGRRCFEAAREKPGKKKRKGKAQIRLPGSLPPIEAAGDPRERNYVKERHHEPKTTRQDGGGDYPRSCPRSASTSYTSPDPGRDKTPLPRGVRRAPARDWSMPERLSKAPATGWQPTSPPSQVAPDSLLGAPAPCLACVTMTVTA